MGLRGTTILCLKKGNEVVIAADGQVSLGNMVMKSTARKLRTLCNNKIVAGFAGSTADAFTLFERFDAKLSESNGILARACIELAKDWRNDRYLRRLEAMLVVGDSQSLFLLSGVGDVIQPDDGVIGIGSGGGFALAAARALIRANGERMSAKEIVETAMGVAAEICPFTNSRLTLEQINTI